MTQELRLEDRFAINEVLQHLISNISITLTGEPTATAVSYVRAG
jgi:hypothetical protein